METSAIYRVGTLIQAWVFTSKFELIFPNFKKNFQTDFFVTRNQATSGPMHISTHINV